MNSMNELPPLKFERKRFQVAKTCPCGKSNRDGKFVPYINHEGKGFCHACGENFLPEIEKVTVSSFQAPKERKPETPSYIKPGTLKLSLSEYTKNAFAQFLINTFGQELATLAIGKYFVGTTKQGLVCFWQIDKAGKIRSGKLIAYDSTTGHRLKDVPPAWVHTKMKLFDFRLKQCLFGEHLIKGNKKPAAVVESEKTAIISSLYFPDFVWLATGGKDGLTNEKMQVLKGRKVILFPDLDGFDLWTQRAQELAPMLDVTVSSLLERKATAEERAGKLDIADYLLRFPVQEFIKPQERTGPYFETLKDGRVIEMHPGGFPLSWDIGAKEKTQLERMIEKNPVIAEMMKRLDLVKLN